MKSQSYKERLKKVDTYITKNKLYIAIIIIIIILILSNAFGFKEKNAENSSNAHADSSMSDNENETAKDVPHWRFYWSDLVILAVGGGFCTFKIILQHRKAREKL